jgi:PAS domain-containing protein
VIKIPKINQRGNTATSNQSQFLLEVVLQIIREPFLILDDNLILQNANESFCKTFQLEKKEIVGKNIFAIGNDDWNIADLKKLLTVILPKNDFFNGFELNHEFSVIGRKILIVNARKINSPDLLSHSSSVIFLAMEDITELMLIAERLAGQANLLETKMTSKLQKLEGDILRLENEVRQFKLQSL